MKARERNGARTIARVGNAGGPPGRALTVCTALCALLVVGCGDDADDAGRGAGAGAAGAGAGIGAGAGTGAGAVAGAGSGAGRGGAGGASMAGRSGGGGTGAGRGGSGAGGSGGSAGATAGAGGSAAGAGGSSAGAGGSGERSFSTHRDEFFGDPRCPQSGVWVCDDFESENAGAEADGTVWRRVGMMPVISTDRAARGTKSLKVHTSNSSSSAIEVTQIFPAPNNTVWGRMFIWIDDLPTAPMWAHWNIVAANGDGDGSEIRVGGQWDGQRNRFGTGTDHGATGDWTDLDMDPSAAQAAVREDEWLCVEWLYKGDTNEIRFFMDAQEHPSLHQTENDHGGQSDAPFVFPEFDRLAVGFWMYHPNTTPLAYDVWIDEVVLDDERIGCVL